MDVSGLVVALAKALAANDIEAAVAAAIELGRCLGRAELPLAVPDRPAEHNGTAVPYVTPAAAGAVRSVRTGLGRRGPVRA